MNPYLFTKNYQDGVLDSRSALSVSNGIDFKNIYTGTPAEISMFDYVLSRKGNQLQLKKILYEALISFVPMDKWGFVHPALKGMNADNVEMYIAKRLSLYNTSKAMVTIGKTLTGEDLKDFFIEVIKLHPDREVFGLLGIDTSENAFNERKSIASKSPDYEDKITDEFFNCGGKPCGCDKGKDKNSEFKNACGCTHSAEGEQKPYKWDNKNNGLAITAAILATAVIIAVVVSKQN